MAANLNRNSKSKPQLVMVIEPETRLRFRYESEGGSHGALLGKHKVDGKKTYPTVKLEGYRGKKPVYIQVSLYTEDEKEHVFEFRGHVHHIKEYVNKDNTATFTNLKIWSKKKDEIEKLLMARKLHNIKDGISAKIRDHLVKVYSKEVKERAKAILNSVRLCFEAYEEDKPNVPLCSLFSEVIYNTKAAAKGDLKIHRLSRPSGSWRGGDEVILLCDKIQKENIRVRFYETDDSEEPKVIWENYGQFSPADVHYQVAICFKTPPYRMNFEKEVFLCLERNGEKGDPVKFTYIPEETSKKRKYVSSFSNETSGYSSESYESQRSFPSPECSSNDADFLQAKTSVNTEEEDDIMNEDIREILEQVAKTMFENLEPDDLLRENLIKVGDENVDLVNHIVDPNSVLNPIDFQMDIGILQGEMAVLEVNDTSSASLAVKENAEGKCEIYQHLKKFNSYEKLFSAILSKRDQFGNTLLHIAILNNKDVNPLLKVNKIAKSRLINIQNCEKQTALHLATVKNDINLVKTLLQNGSNPNIKDADGNNCYHIAAKNNMHSIFDILSHVPKLDVLNYEGLSPLHIAVMKNSDRFFERVKIFDINSNITEGKAGKSLLHYAAQCQPSFVAKLLDIENTDVNIQDFEGNTPLHIACAYENINVVKLLLEAGASPLVKNFKEDLNLSKEDSEDSDSVGLLPEDMTNNAEILMLLEKASEVKPDIPPNIPDHEDLPEPNRTADEMVEKLCNILDEDMKWKTIAPYFVDEKYFTSLEMSDSPTKALLSYIKKEYQKNHIETFKSALELAGYTDALQIIELSCF